MIPSPRFLLLLPLVLFTSHSVEAQVLAHLPGQLLVSLEFGATPEKLVQRSAAELSTPVFGQKKVANLLNIWQLQTTAGTSSELAALNWLRRQPEVRTAQLNHLLQNRGGPENNVLPNDPLFSEQWQYLNNGANAGMVNADLDADQAWDLTTGGLSAAGDTIVVAVIDGGVDFLHPDLVENAWHNWTETPNDGLDNDQNGFIDDFRGWNVDAQNDYVAGQTTGHGTPICGILGARGDNGIGVTGVNWQVKIMFVASSGSEASILAAYDYVWKARSLYNTTNGQQGAFIAAVNCSWGINYGQPADAPLWCAAFDTLGAAGILSVAATANLPVDVDLSGDLPTACSSDYLITVTSLQRDDQKAASAAWGAKQIDLGAYGQDVFTLGEGNTYGSFSGTSYAAPQVTGAIALLYSMHCANLIAVAKSDPAAAALWAKDMLLNSTTPNPSLMNLTSTGGRLNLFNLLKEYVNLCNPCPAPFALWAASQDSTITINWPQTPVYQKFNIRYRLLEQLEWVVQDSVISPFILSVPELCQPYEISLQAHCVSGQVSPWSEPVHFVTAGCCVPAPVITLQTATTTSLTLIWDSSASNNGGLRYRLAGTTDDWLNMATNGNTATLTDLNACADYEIQLYSVCTNLLSSFSPLFKFATTCGTCSEGSYCTANAGQSSSEWIAAISIDDWSQASAIGGGGYQNFTGDQVATLELHPHTTPDVTVTPGFYGTPTKEYFRIYVDFNMDGDFEDADELAFNPGYAHNSTMSGHLQVPFFATVGYTRMRVLMKAKNATNQLPLPCESFDFGQIEDYCVLLSPSTSLSETVAGIEEKLRLSPQPAHTTVQLEWPVDAGKTTQLQVWNAAGLLILNQPLTTTSSLFNLNINDWQAGIYIISIQTEKGRRQARLLKW